MVASIAVWVPCVRPWRRADWWRLLAVLLTGFGAQCCAITSSDEWLGDGFLQVTGMFGQLWQALRCLVWQSGG